MVKVAETILQNKWEREVGEITKGETIHHNSIVQKLSEEVLKDFQYKVNIQILVTKSFLHRIGKIDDYRCSYCNEHQESTA